MKSLTATLVSAVATLAFVAAASAQTSTGNKTKTQQSSQEYWWNDPGAMEEAKSNWGDMVTGLDPKGGSSGTGAGSGETGLSKDAPSGSSSE